MRLRNEATGQEQSIHVMDITTPGRVCVAADVVYCDPPWSPGCLKWWHTYAGQEAHYDYDAFLSALCMRIAEAAPWHVAIEQSVDPERREMLIAAIAACASWTLPLMGVYKIVYGRPCRPNVLMHWGSMPLATNPTGLCGDDLVQMALAGMGDLRGCVVYDPCMGKGATSRVAHALGASFVGSEMNHKRIRCAIGWLKKHGYTEL